MEDDRQLAESLRRGLAEAGMAADTVGDGEEALHMAAATAYDVLVLDVMLPGRDGFSLAGALRARRVRAPILMLTGRGAVEDRVHGLEAGADDYLVKPFAFRELVARIRALSRRHLADRSAVLTAGPLRLDTAARRLLVGDREVPLTAKEFSILECFMLHQGQVLTRDQVLESAWDWGLDDGHNLVEVYVHRLRRKLGEVGVADAIRTLRGAGYRFEV